MMEEEFYSTIKLSSGEEIVAKVSYLPEEDSILIESPMIVERLSQKKNGKSVQGFILKEWLHSTYDSIFVINMKQVITMTELDKRIEIFYLSNLKDGSTKDSFDDPINIRPDKFSKQMGYLGSVKDTKQFLEEIYKKS